MQIDTYTALFIVTWLAIIGLVILFFVVIELVITKKEMDKYYDENKSEDLKEKFQKNIEIVKTQETEEILECLIEMEKLDQVYRDIMDNNYEFIDEMTYLKIKEDALDEIISRKIENSKTDKEKIKSIIDEIDACQERYPEYNEIFIKNKNKCKEMSKKKKKLENK